MVVIIIIVVISCNSNHHRYIIIVIVINLFLCNLNVRKTFCGKLLTQYYCDINYVVGILSSASVNTHVFDRCILSQLRRQKEMRNDSKVIIIHFTRNGHFSMFAD